ncbi:MAG: hypothetical protein KAT56_10960, partial [Sedimentisphaerales bacterium]|nr:hypothetical protein [Sedimentisphaerales bacterium]
MTEHILTGFGFGPIQAGLFAREAFYSDNFSRIVIAEIDRNLVNAVRANNGSYYVNIAKSDGIDIEKIDGVELFDPADENDKNKLLEVLSQSTEIVTSLPSVEIYNVGRMSIASLIAQGLKNSIADATIIYAAENNNAAAEILEKAVTEKLNRPISDRTQFLNTVIGKMSRLVTDPEEIKQKNLKPIAPGIDRTFLIEEFNEILVTKCSIKGFKPGIEVFLEKDDLLPFEEVKLYGHNAVHALLAYLGAFKGYTKMKELGNDREIMSIARRAFLDESGAALIKKHSNLDDKLFTEAGFTAYAEDLLERMTSPFLDDTIERAARDPIRKLGHNDRIFGTMTLALELGIEPVNMALGAAAGITYLLRRAEEYNLPKQLCRNNW